MGRELAVADDSKPVVAIGVPAVLIEDDESKSSTAEQQLFDTIISSNVVVFLIDVHIQIG